MAPRSPRRRSSPPSPAAARAAATAARLGGSYHVHAHIRLGIEAKKEQRQQNQKRAGTPWTGTYRDLTRRSSCGSGGHTSQTMGSPAVHVCSCRVTSTLGPLNALHSRHWRTRRAAALCSRNLCELRALSDRPTYEQPSSGHGKRAGEELLIFSSAQVLELHITQLYLILLCLFFVLARALSQN